MSGVAPERWMNRSEVEEKLRRTRSPRERGIFTQQLVCPHPLDAIVSDRDSFPYFRERCTLCGYEALI